MPGTPGTDMPASNLTAFQITTSTMNVKSLLDYQNLSEIFIHADKTEMSLNLTFTETMILFYN